MSGRGKICYISSRINFFEFENACQFKQEISKKSIYPIYAEYNLLKEEIVIGTTSDLRFIDVHTGKIKKLYKGLTTNEYDNITVFKMV